MKILTWNINGYRSAQKDGYFSNLLKKYDLDIICLQEIKMNNEIMEFENFHKYYNFANKLGYSGVAIFTKEKPINVYYKIGEERFDSEGRFIALEFKNFYLVNVYVPQGGRNKENLEYKLKSLDNLLEYIKESFNKEIIICTDFNIAHDERDVLNYKSNYNNIMFTKEERDVVSKYINNGFIDTFREKYPDIIKYSWWSYAFNSRERDIGWRIDYIYVTQNLFKWVKKIEYLKEQMGSDHCPLLMTIGGKNENSR